MSWVCPAGWDRVCVGLWVCKLDGGLCGFAGWDGVSMWCICGFVECDGLCVFL